MARSKDEYLKNDTRKFRETCRRRKSFTMSKWQKNKKLNLIQEQENVGK